jgi:plasmid stabilization system protein ParE
MNALFQLTPQAIEDLDAIWWTIAEDNRDAAERVETEILAACHRLARHPRMGTKRQDVTLPQLFLGNIVAPLKTSSNYPQDGQFGTCHGFSRAAKGWADEGFSP